MRAVADAADGHAAEARGQRPGQDAQSDHGEDAGDQRADQERDDVGGEGVPAVLEGEPDVEPGSANAGVAVVTVMVDSFPLEFVA